MVTCTRQSLLIGSIVLCLAFVVGCGTKPVGRSDLGIKIGDRDVKASLDGAGFISSEGDAAIITFAAGKLVVEKGAVRLGGEELAKVPETAKKVDVDYTGGHLTVTADGKSVVSKALPK